MAAYRVYWSDVLMRRVAPERAEQGLRAALARLEPLFGSDAKTGEQALRRRLEAQGWFMLGGRTQPLFEFMLWSRQTRSTERVELPFDSVEVTVTLLDGFASLGWAAWGSCDRSHTGGWVTDEGIMVVAPAWDRTSEAYRVSLIAHEAQHFADLKRYPRLGQPDLEFRAKLVELVLAERTQRELLGAFAAQARRDRTLPHPFANHWVIERLRQRTGQGDLPSLPSEVVADAARAELVAHAAAVEAQGALRAQSALPD